MTFPSKANLLSFMGLNGSVSCPTAVTTRVLNLEILLKSLQTDLGGFAWSMSHILRVEGEDEVLFVRVKVREESACLTSFHRCRSFSRFL